MNAAAGVLYVDPADNVLMVQASYKQHWDLPGGVVEPGESPMDAAVREVKEELGVVREVGRLLVVDYLPATAARGALTAYIFQGMPFDTRLITVDGVEVIGWDWCDAADRAEYTATAPIFRRRLEYAIDAWQFGSCHYLEDGWKR